MDGIVPFVMKGMPHKMKCHHVLIGDLEAFGVHFRIQFGPRTVSPDCVRVPAIRLRITS